MDNDLKLKLTWYIHFKCNYRCPYCWFYGRWQDLSRCNRYFATEEIVKSFRDYLHKQYGEILINITGGEPFLYPNFTEVVRELSFYHKFCVETSLSEPLDHFTKQVGYLKVEIIPAFHPLFANLRVFIRQVLMLKERGFTERVRFLAYPQQLEMIPYYKDIFLKEGLFFDVVPFWGRHKDKIYPQGYTPFRKRLIGIDTAAGGPQRFKHCNLGNNHAVIMPDGALKRCEGSRVREMGNIFDATVKIHAYDGPMECKAPYSPCNENAVIFCPDAPAVKKNKLVALSVPGEKKATLIEFNRRESIPPRQVFFSWYINTECNYKCSYCKPSFHGKTLIMDTRKWVDIWDKVYDSYGACSLHLSGGEPFLYPSLIELVKELSGKHTFEFSSNLSADIAPFIERIDPRRARVGCSLHPESADTKRFIKRVVLLRDSGFGVWVNYVGYPPFLGQVAGYKKEFQEMGIPFHVLPYNGKFEDREFPRDYREEELKLMNPGSTNAVDKKATDWRVEEGKNSIKGSLCRMGQMYARVYPNADAFRCCGDKAARLGNLADNTFVLHETPQPCECENCPCWRCMLVGKERHWSDHWVSLI